MKDYSREIDSINSSVAKFNAHILPEFQLRLFDPDDDFEKKNIVKIVHGDWNAFPFPNNGTRGVYFVFGYEKNQPDKKGLYVGKASFSSSTSGRLYAHLHPTRSDEKFTMNGYNNEVYVIEFIASIDMDQQKISFLAPALEEFLITSLRNDLNLINGTGN